MNSSAETAWLARPQPAQPDAGHVQSLLGLILLVGLTIRVIYTLCDPPKGNAHVAAPFVGSPQSWLARIQFLTGATETISRGYRQFKDQIFKLSGNDMLIVPAKYVEELRQLPDSYLDAIQANTDNFQGVYSATSILNEGVLHNFVLQTKLTPKLSALIPIIREELEYAMEKEFPKCDDDWQSEEAFSLVIRMISRLASRLFVGPELCRSDEWLNTSRGYTESVFRAIIFLRIFPPWLKPLMAMIDINSWKVQYHLRNARRLLIPLILQRREASAAGDVSGQGLKFTNLLQLMDDNAQGIDRDPEKLTRRTLVLTLASSHTTSMAACQALFELCDHPEYIPILREEVRAAVEEDGGWKKSTLSKMRKLDSFLRESQRMHPPSLLGFKRNVLKDIQLSDGQKIPAGAHMLMPIAPHAMDDPRVLDPDTFDGLRWYRMRQEDGQSHKFQFVTTDKHTLHFGHGRHACPGRFLASNTIKVLLGQLLLDYDFGFPDGQGRPDDVHAHEYVFPNPAGRVRFRRREMKA